jgi:hypothetical protein
MTGNRDQLRDMRQQLLDQLDATPDSSGTRRQLAEIEAALWHLDHGDGERRGKCSS